LHTVSKEYGDISGSHGHECEKDSFRDVAPSSLVEIDLCFRGGYFLHHQGDKKMAVFWDVAPYVLVEINEVSEVLTLSIMKAIKDDFLQGCFIMKAVNKFTDIALTMEAVSSFETSVSFHQPTPRNIVITKNAFVVPLSWSPCRAAEQKSSPTINKVSSFLNSQLCKVIECYSGFH
jgi:hypothetical protein